MPISKIKAPLRDPNGYSANGAHDSARQENSQTRRAPGGIGDLSMQLDDFSEPPTVLPGQRINTPPASPSPRPPKTPAMPTVPPRTSLEEDEPQERTDEQLIGYAPETPHGWNERQWSFGSATSIRAGELRRKMSEHSEDPAQIMRQIKFKEKVMKTLKESCDQALAEMQLEVNEMKAKLATKTAKRPAKNSVGTDRLEETQAETKQENPFYIVPNKRMHNSSLFDAYLEAIGKSRAASRKNFDAPPEWWRNRRLVDKMILRSSFWSAVFGILGTFCAMGQNELIIQETEPRAQVIDALKGLNTICTVCCLVFVFRLYWLHLVVQRINIHCRRLLPMGSLVPRFEGLKSWYFWTEVVIIGCHCPPWYTDEFATTTYSNIIVYRVETIACLVNTCRFYLVWRYVREFMFLGLKSRHTIQNFTGIKFGSRLVLKFLMNGWSSTLIILIIWGICILLLGYWMRAAELTACYLKTTLHPACQEPESRTWNLFEEVFEHWNDYYIWDSLWMLYITSLTVGYGDVTPTTHYGRVCASVITIVGICLSSLLVASIMSNLEWLPDEIYALHILERAVAREEIKAIALAKMRGQLKRYVERWRIRQHEKDLSTGRVRRDPPYKTGIAGLWEALSYNVYKWLGLYDPGVESKQLCEKLLRFKRKTVQENSGNFVTLQSNEDKCIYLFSKVKHLDRVTESIHDRLQIDPVELFDSLLEHRRRLSNSQTVPLKKKKSQSWINAEHGGTYDFVKREEKNRRWVQLQRIRTLIHKSKYQGVAALEPERRGARLLPQEKTNLESFLASIFTTSGTLNLHWMRDNRKINRRLIAIRFWLCVIGMFGTCVSLVQNEMVIIGYGSVEQLNRLKLLNTGCSMACVLLVFALHWMKQVLNRVMQHVFRFENVSLSSWYLVLGVFKNPLFWVEIFLVGVHCPPGFDEDYGYRVMGNYILYRIETGAQFTCFTSTKVRILTPEELRAVFACINLLRLYLLWHPFADWMLSDLPKRQTLEGYNRFKFGAGFIMKRALNSPGSPLFITLIWIFTLFVCGYWFRSAELTACQFPHLEGQRPKPPDCDSREATIWMMHGSEITKINDTLLQNACWLMFVTATTVGYGETYVSTHAGRATAAITALVGTLVVALMTAVLAKLLEWTEDEMTAKKMLERVATRDNINVFAVQIIQRWWRQTIVRRTGGVPGRYEEEEDKFILRTTSEALRREQIQLSYLFHLDEAGGQSELLDRIIQGASHVQEAVELIAFELYAHDVEELVRLHASWEDPENSKKTLQLMRRLMRQARKYDENKKTQTSNDASEKEKAETDSHTLVHPHEHTSSVNSSDLVTPWEATPHDSNEIQR